MADVLTIAKEKHYMVLDPVPQEPAEVKPMVQVYARKKALAGAASVIMMGADRLKNCQNELARNRSTPDFHIELLRLRQNWRLKKVSNSIIGDLSYRTGPYFSTPHSSDCCSECYIDAERISSGFQVSSDGYVRSYESRGGGEE